MKKEEYKEEMRKSLESAIFFNKERIKILEALLKRIEKGDSSFELAWRKAIWGEHGLRFIFGNWECGKFLLEDPLRNLKSFYSSLEKEWFIVSKDVEENKKLEVLRQWVILKIKKVEATIKRLEQYRRSWI